MLAWKAFTDKYMSATEFDDSLAAAGFGMAATVVQVLRQCGNDLSRENIMRQAANLKDFRAPLLSPGITVSTSPTNYSPIRQLQLATFDGANWEPIGEVLSD
jgi:branched-chain amino acid transport system substrate-binding protein